MTVEELDNEIADTKARVGKRKGDFTYIEEKGGYVVDPESDKAKEYLKKLEAYRPMIARKEQADKMSVMTDEEMAIEIDTAEKELIADKIDLSNYDKRITATQEKANEIIRGKYSKENNKLANAYTEQRTALEAEKKEAAKRIKEKEALVRDMKDIKDFSGWAKGFDDPDFDKYVEQGKKLGAGVQFGGNTQVSGFTEQKKADYLKRGILKYTDDEYQMALYLVAKDYKNKDNPEYEPQFEKYAKAIKKVSTAREMGEFQGIAQDMAKNYPIAASGFSLLAAPAQGIGYLKAGFDTITGQEVDPNDPAMAASRFVSTVRGQVASDIQKSIGGEGGQFIADLYGTGMSVGDFLIATGISGGLGAGGAAAEAIPLAIMSTGSATNAMLDAFDRGATQEEAVAAGFWAGVAEVAFEKISVGSFLKMTKAGRGSFIKNAFKQFGIEATEEMATEIANIISDNAIMGEKSNYNIAVQNYIKQGMSKEKAEIAASQDLIVQIGKAGFYGGLGGFGTGGVGTAIGNINNKQNTGTPSAQQNIPIQNEQANRQATQPPLISENDVDGLINNPIKLSNDEYGYAVIYKEKDGTYSVYKDRNKNGRADESPYEAGNDYQANWSGDKKEIADYINQNNRLAQAPVSPVAAKAGQTVQIQGESKIAQGSPGAQAQNRTQSAAQNIPSIVPKKTTGDIAFAAQNETIVENRKTEQRKTLTEKG
jgi:hypothetical protein